MTARIAVGETGRRWVRPVRGNADLWVAGVWVRDLDGRLAQFRRDPARLTLRLPSNWFRVAGWTFAIGLREMRRSAAPHQGPPTTRTGPGVARSE